VSSFFRRLRIALAVRLLPKHHSNDQQIADVVSSLLSGQARYPVKELRIEVESFDTSSNRRQRFCL